MVSADFPQYSSGERLADFWIHILGITGSAIALTVLLVMTVGTLPTVSTVSLSVYSIGVLAVFCCSAAYNLVSNHQLKTTLRQLDQAAIYVKIAAVYTPFAAVKIGGWSGGGLLGVVWAIAIFGLVLKLVCPERLVKTSYALYLAQGWAALLFIHPLFASVSSLTLVMLCIGGILYTVGVVFHLWSTLKYHNAIWHGFVVCGSGCHYVAILDAVALA
jgi:hemolysin III